MVLAWPSFWQGNCITARCGERKSKHLPVTPEGKCSGLSVRSIKLILQKSQCNFCEAVATVQKQTAFSNLHFRSGVSGLGDCNCSTCCRTLSLSLFSLHTHSWDRDNKLCSNSTETLCWLCVTFPYCPVSLSAVLLLHFSCLSTATMSGTGHMHWDTHKLKVHKVLAGKPA